MPHKSDADCYRVVDVISKKAPGFAPRIGLILGSGLGALVDSVSEKITIPYSELPGFPVPSVKGHKGALIMGMLGGVRVVCLQGRSHTYENLSFAAVKTYVRTLKLLGCEMVVITNAAGSIRADMAPGSLMMITDHINFIPGNPLAGPNDDDFGPRFPPVDNAYDNDLCAQLRRAAEASDVKLHEGVYISVLGPSYETAAEIKAFRAWGADAVGMSTVPEVLVAVHCGLRVAAISSITNYATGLSSTAHDHNAVLDVASHAATSLIRLVQQFIRQYGH